MCEPRANPPTDVGKRVHKRPTYTERGRLMLRISISLIVIVMVAVALIVLLPTLGPLPEVPEATEEGTNVD